MMCLIWSDGEKSLVHVLIYFTVTFAQILKSLSIRTLSHLLNQCCQTMYSKFRNYATFWTWISNMPRQICLFCLLTRVLQLKLTSDIIPLAFSQCYLWCIYVWIIHFMMWSFLGMDQLTNKLSRSKKWILHQLFLPCWNHFQEDAR